ncbi:heat-inducible transcriptional repressor HrcA [Desertibacillus haloalkaliphilus]|uniref:heat-inducible transcriptional repressor HrcA n=1 Tax=Desertibacillus haloalkaliphilus TaxID=1328930 RepID=UPI001C27C889|nr:heat-inducible transcriptional repressor HrcA [Desertibacillus haloalkaliphilus]MBU8905630.1 heat-inducible transcriptional repressor HrcA [Desertibacillus haloalkaliphilus]
MLTERQLFILQAIVDDYIRSAEPVGSRSISKREDISYSPATIRNEMADLEELGFLDKPHSSAGRIPSQRGYRYYVDHLLMPHYLSDTELVDIKKLFAEKIDEVEQLIQQSAKVLSSLTSYISIVLGPEMFETRLKHLQIIPLTHETAVAIIVTDTGHVENQTITIPGGIELADLEMVVNILNDHLKGVPLNDLNKRLNTEVAAVLRSHIGNVNHVMSMLNRTLKPEKSEKVFYGGKTNLLMQPEFRDIEKVRLLLNILEEDDLVHQLFRSNSAGINVKIGQENNLEAIDNCSIITASYSIAGKHMGTVGILGPTRMEYPRVIGILDHISKDLTKVLTELYQKG